MKLAVHYELRSGRETAPGCIAGVLRRILCRNFLGRRCSGRSESVKDEEEQREVAAAAASPGIVARLMGLESLPSYHHVQPETISRTRSANSVEPWTGPGLLCEQRSGHGCPQLQKSQSFHEVPTYLRKENEEFLVLSFGNDNWCEPPLEQCDVNESRGEKKKEEKKRSRNKSLENAADNMQYETKNPVFVSENSNHMAEGSFYCRKKLSFAEVEMEMEFSSQNSSPISVLDLIIDEDGECLTSHDSSAPDVCKVWALQRNAEEENSLKKFSLNAEDKSKNTKKFELVARDFPNTWPYICKIGEEDLNQSSWITRKMAKSEEAEEIGSVIGLEILDLLLQETVAEMCN